MSHLSLLLMTMRQATKQISAYYRALGCKGPPGLHFGPAQGVPVDGKAISRGRLLTDPPSLTSPSTYSLRVPRLPAAEGTWCSVQLCPKSPSERKAEEASHMPAGLYPRHQRRKLFRKVQVGSLLSAFSNRQKGTGHHSSSLGSK